MRHVAPSRPFAAGPAAAEGDGDTRPAPPFLRPKGRVGDVASVLLPLD